ncbi:hypothetical protein LguiA_019430 [Lonicera macranthoides]
MQIVLLLVFLSVYNAKPVTGALNRSDFPIDFAFGTASSAYQYEGAVRQDGKRASIWDTFTAEHSGFFLRDKRIFAAEKVKDNSSGKVANDFYHRYKEDVATMKLLGFDAFRFSISWPRILPGLQPFVTLFHWDLPQALEDEYGGFLSQRIVNDFRDYAELCFKVFGDRVKHWITINEPLSYSREGYATGVLAPGRCSSWQKRDCTGGNSSIEPYLVTHHQLLAHAAAVRVYKEKYQVTQTGKIGISLNVNWILPYNQDSAWDLVAANRTLDFIYGWFMEPLMSGSYPTTMVKRVGQRLPKFSRIQSSMLKGSFDFIGINYYTARYAMDIPCQDGNFNYINDSCTYLTTMQHNGTFIGLTAGSSWLCIYPEGLKYLLLYTMERFNNPSIFITENGVDELNSGRVSLNDHTRVEFYKDHLLNLHQAIKLLNFDRAGVNVRGYFAWSLLDNWEWSEGYTVRFGLIFVDYNNGLRRFPKRSAIWFKGFLHRGAGAHV